MNVRYGVARYKKIFGWKLKVCYKKGIPFAYLIKHLSDHPALQKGNEIESEIAIINGKTCVVLRLE